MDRALLLEDAIKVFSERYRDELENDILLFADQDVIRELKLHLEPFWELTIDLQSQAVSGTHGAIWESLPALEYLLYYLEGLKDNIPKQKKRIRECVMNSWSLLQKYYNLTNKNYTIYACATLLNPGLRRAYLDKNWTDKMKDFINPIITICWDTYRTKYLPRAQPKPTASTAKK